MLDPKDEIKEKIDLVELIGEYLELKPAGSHGFKAVCPFHSEKTPSFHVSSDRQIWHCFGCSEGGDCFSFVMKMEGMDFAEALLHLGQKAGVEIRRMSTTEGNIKQRLYEINELASRYYKTVLERSQTAEPARLYVNQRGITQELSEIFRLGYAGKEWDALTQFLLGRGYSETEIISAGLAQKRKSGTGAIDRFRERLMIPLRDQHGKTVGFTARVFPKSTPGVDEGPKYMNSPETPIYHKGRLLFGLDLAKRASKDHKAIIVVEGNLDVIASHKAGVEHVVASSGTALTQEQLSLLARYVKTLIFCFDRDAAGLQAAKRGVSIARKLKFDVRAIVLPQSVKDPDELVQKDPTQWKALCTHSIPFMEYLIARVTEGKDLSHVDHKRAVSQEIFPALFEIEDFVEREHWTHVIAGMLGLDPKQLSRGNPTPTSEKTQVLTPPLPKKSKYHKAQSLLFGAWVNGLLLSFEAFADSGELAELYTYGKKIYDSGSYAPKQTFFLRFREYLTSERREDLVGLLDKLSLLAEKTFADLPPHAAQTQLKRIEEVFVREKTHALRASIAAKIRQAELAGDTSAVERLIFELTYAQKDPEQETGEKIG